jgi:hypothetical protein
MTVTQKQRKYRNAVVRVLQFYAQENAKRVLRTPAELQALHGKRVEARGQNR